MSRKKVTFEEVAEAFEEVKGHLGLKAELRPVAGNDSQCCVVADNLVEIETLAHMKAGLSVMQLLARHQTKLLSVDD